MGPQGWWPAETKEEIILGAILVQNTNWQNVTYSLKNLWKLTQFESKRIFQLELVNIESAIRPSGFFKNKAKAIHEFFHWLSQFHFDLELVQNRYGNNLRKALLSIHGIGEETADALLLYVFDKPVFIADKYAQKLFSKLGVAGIGNYKQMKEKVDLPTSFTIEKAQEFHGLIDEFGKLYLKSDMVFEKSFLYGSKLIL